MKTNSYTTYKHKGILLARMDEKGFGSNAHWWKRLKHANTLQPYLRIAEKLGIHMPLVTESFEYIPNSMNTIRSPVHADFQHEVWFPYLRDAETFPRDSKSKYVITYNERKPIVFYRPYDTPTNIASARDRIAEHLARNNLSLGSYISDADLAPVIWSEMPIVNYYGSMIQTNPHGSYAPQLHNQSRRIRIQDDDLHTFSTSPVLARRNEGIKPLVSWSEDLHTPQQRLRTIRWDYGSPKAYRHIPFDASYHDDEYDSAGELDMDIEHEYDSLLTPKRSSDLLETESIDEWCKKNDIENLWSSESENRRG